jgi:hypothetical protein
MTKKAFCFSSFYCLLFQLLNRKSMFAVPHSDINSLMSGLLHLSSQPYCEKSRSAKEKDGIINLILRNYVAYWTYLYVRQKIKCREYGPWHLHVG